MTTMYVTVGSTSFDTLVSAVCSREVLQLVASNGFRRVVLQIGRGETIPSQVSPDVLQMKEKGCATASTSPPLDVEWYRYKDSITEDIRSASLVVGHAGAGTVLETLMERKPLVAVLNEGLMDGHQSELAEQMEEEGALVSCKGTSALEVTLQGYFASPKKLATYDTEPGMFSAFLEDFMGLC